MSSTIRILEDVENQAPQGRNKTTNAGNGDNQRRAVLGEIRGFNQNCGQTLSNKTVSILMLLSLNIFKYFDAIVSKYLRLFWFWQYGVWYFRVIFIKKARSGSLLHRYRGTVGIFWPIVHCSVSSYMAQGILNLTS